MKKIKLKKKNLRLAKYIVTNSSIHMALEGQPTSKEFKRKSIVDLYRKLCREKLCRENW